MNTRQPLLKDTNLADLLRANNGSSVTISVNRSDLNEGREPKLLTLEGNKAIRYLSKVDGWRDIVLLDDCQITRQLSELGLIELSQGRLSTSSYEVPNGSGTGATMRVTEPVFDQAYRRGPLYDTARVVAVQPRSYNLLVALGFKEPKSIQL